MSTKDRPRGSRDKELVLTYTTCEGCDDGGDAEEGTLEFHGKDKYGRRWNVHLVYPA